MADVFSARSGKFVSCEQTSGIGAGKGRIVHEEAGWCRRGRLGVSAAGRATAAARPVVVLALSRWPRRRQVALDVGGSANGGARRDLAHSFDRSDYGRLPRREPRGQERHPGDLRPRSTPALGVVNPAGVAERRGLCALLRRRAGVAARPAMRIVRDRQDCPHALPSGGVRHHDAGFAAS
jgi:hypothetical protein